MGKGFGRPQSPLHSYKLPNISEKSNYNSYSYVDPRCIPSNQGDTLPLYLPFPAQLTS
jgi:hypothetical protein